MARHKKQHHEEEMGEAWLLPYSDLMTLLLAVFIVLFAVSNLDKSKAAEMAAQFGSMMSVEGGVGVLPGTKAILNGSGEKVLYDTLDPQDVQEKSQPDIKVKEMQSMKRLQDKLEDFFEQQNMATSVETSIDERGLVVSFSSNLLFDSGKADIKPEFVDAMVTAGTELGKLDNYIRVEGHTDNVPINTARFPSNWELSSSRASVVARLFVERCGVAPEKVATVGYASYRPIADNSTIEGRAKNRRVDVIIMNTKYDSLESQTDEPEQMFTIQ